MTDTTTTEAPVYHPETELIKLFPKLYVGFKAQDDHDEENGAPGTRPHLGFATPYEENAAGKKRQETVDRWAKDGESYYHWNPKTKQYTAKKRPVRPVEIIDNVPIEGFKIGEDIRRVYWGGGNVVWRIYDPRGFELEISSANLAKVIEHVGLAKGGAIAGRCIWGRLGGQNLLIPEGTEVWDKMVKDQVKIASNAKLKPMKEVPVGATVSTKTGDKIYLGEFYAHVREHQGSSYQEGPSTIEDKGKYHALCDADDLSLSYIHLSLYKSNPALSVLNKPHKTAAWIDKRRLAATYISLASGGRNSSTVLALLKDKTPVGEFKLTPVNVDEIKMSMDAFHSSHLMHNGDDVAIRLTNGFGTSVRVYARRGYLSTVTTPDEEIATLFLSPSPKTLNYTYAGRDHLHGWSNIQFYKGNEAKYDQRIRDMLTQQGAGVVHYVTGNEKHKAR
jgi:hypothetical protein